MDRLAPNHASAVRSGYRRFSADRSRSYGEGKLFMKSPNPRTKTTNELGVLLRHWRDLRGRSQFDLSLDTGVSQKQISFVESGRSVPNRQTLMAIAQALDVPLRDRNTLLLAAGYAPMFSEGTWDSMEMKSVTDALKRILRQHEPFPALVMDRYWNVLMTNECAPRFFNCFVDMAAREGPRNMLHLMFDPKGMRPFVANWQDVAKGLFERVYRESVGRVVDDKTKELLAALLAYPDVKSEWKNPVALSFMPVIPMSFVKDDHVLNYFSMVTTVGTPQTVAAQELRIECMFPADAATEVHHDALMSNASVSSGPAEH
jgi:transcriptional regulator with XRE-family HTH domain